MLVLNHGQKQATANEICSMMIVVHDQVQAKKLKSPMENIRHRYRSTDGHDLQNCFFVFAAAAHFPRRHLRPLDLS